MVSGKYMIRYNGKREIEELQVRSRGYLETIPQPLTMVLFQVILNRIFLKKIFLKVSSFFVYM